MRTSPKKMGAAFSSYTDLRAVAQYTAGDRYGYQHGGQVD